MKTIYTVHEDGVYSYITKNIVESTIKVDNDWHQFDSLKKAKSCLLKRLSSIKNEYNRSIKYIKELNEDSVKEN